MGENTTWLEGVTVVGGEGEGVTEGQGGCQGDCPSRDMLLAAAALTGVMAVAGCLGNLLTVMAIVTSELRENVNGLLIGHLSFADLLYCGLLLPLQALAFAEGAWPVPDWVCVLYAVVRYWLIGTNMLLLSAIALYRYLHVVRPPVYRLMAARAPLLAVLAFCWTFALPFVLADAPAVGGRFTFVPQILQCTFAPDAPKSHKVVTITAGFVVPCLFVCLCYARIGCVAYHSRQRASRLSTRRRESAQRQSLRLTAMMLCIFLGFLVTAAPYFAVNTLDPGFQRPAAHVWAPMLAWLLYCLNPLIYTVMDRNFQLAYRHILTGQVCTGRRPALGGQQPTLSRQEPSADPH